MEWIFIEEFCKCFDDLRGSFVSVVFIILDLVCIMSILDIEPEKFLTFNLLLSGQVLYP